MELIDLRIEPGEEPRICGHRGARSHAPENTLAALLHAHALGARACEIDIRLTADDRLVLMHDAAIDRTTDGTGLVRTQTTDQLRNLDAGGWFSPSFAGERVPLLADAIDYATAAGLILRIELKDWHSNDILFPALSAVMADRRGAPVVFCSFDHRQLLALKQEIPSVRTMGIAHGRPVGMLALARSARPDGLSVQAPAMADCDIEELHDAGLALSCYCPINEPVYVTEASLGKLREWWRRGVIDMVTVDDIEWFQRAIRIQ